MQYIFLTIGTVLAVLFLVQMNRGKKYESILEGLDEKAFPLHELYGVGFMWSETSMFSLKGKQAKELLCECLLGTDPDVYTFIIRLYIFTGRLHVFGSRTGFSSRYLPDSGHGAERNTGNEEYTVQADGRV